MHHDHGIFRCTKFHTLNGLPLLQKRTCPLDIITIFSAPGIFTFVLPIPVSDMLFQPFINLIHPFSGIAQRQICHVFSENSMSLHLFLSHLMRKKRKKLPPLIILQQAVLDLSSPKRPSEGRNENPISICHGICSLPFKDQTGLLLLSSWSLFITMNSSTGL